MIKMMDRTGYQVKNYENTARTPKDQCHIPCSKPFLFNLGDHKVVLAPPLLLEYLQDHGDTQRFPSHKVQAFACCAWEHFDNSSGDGPGLAGGRDVAACSVLLSWTGWDSSELELKEPSLWMKHCASMERMTVFAVNLERVDDASFITSTYNVQFYMELEL
ncbi:hypothetical protein DUI87_07655 [Hirundo rustica rustica]|uniref:Uncharacterized protein n=1 Tax=Hirundo rustica rustica TaxID=333673 RepID=A0A3M0KQS9_HIRRU|nr:hypothetical protein DUI87_07655 [Hirundo rustica rustica]